MFRTDVTANSPSGWAGRILTPVGRRRGSALPPATDDPTGRHTPLGAASTIHGCREARRGQGMARLPVVDALLSVDARLPAIGVGWDAAVADDKGKWGVDVPAYAEARCVILADLRRLIASATSQETRTRKQTEQRIEIRDARACGTTVTDGGDRSLAGCLTVAARKRRKVCACKARKQGNPFWLALTNVLFGK